ncbi:hypothetical protein F5Y18DRAFT_396434 [Xylariaceae sp. FL1019]|nr:hypothetical protein F5Y18DRAFT_396434 [Xylariaceae sp. FL1019]
MRVSVIGSALFLGAVYGRPLGRRSLIDISPDISPELDLSSSNDCFGIGISACDPINVDGTQNSNNDNSGDTSSDGASLIDLSSSNDCLGLGVSVCDPINVGGTQNSNNDNARSTKETSTSSDSDSSDSLIDLSPVVSPDIDLSSSNDCFGIGISACDPINVDGTQNSNNNNAAKSVKSTSTTDSNSSSDSLINISPDVSPDVDLSSSNDCIGLGISVCDPINVDGTQNSNNNNGESTSEKATSTSEGGSLINLSPTVSPDLDLSSSNDCFGIGISACDPINVGGTQGSNNNNGK